VSGALEGARQLQAMTVGATADPGELVDDQNPQGDPLGCAE
jgi:hypothetical protein